MAGNVFSRAVAHLRHRRGQALIEYVLAMLFVALALAAAYSLFADQTKAQRIRGRRAYVAAVGQPFRCWECWRVADERMQGWGAYRADLPGDPEPILVFFCGPCAERVFGRRRASDDRAAESAG